MIEDEAAQEVVAFYDAILKSRGIRLAPDSMILDYGCGSGRHTYEYLDAGFHNAFGYDVQNYVVLRSPADRERFRFDPLPGNVGGYPAPPPDFRRVRVCGRCLHPPQSRPIETLGDSAEVRSDAAPGVPRSAHPGDPGAKA
jgi:SAM-dependent methyltransferase